MGFSEEQYNKMMEALEKGKTRSHQFADGETPKPVEPKKALPQKSKNKGSAAKGKMELVIKAMFPDYKKEFQFDPSRRFRADFYIPDINTCIEYEGIYVGKDEMSGHTSMSGYTKDTQKYNLAQILGYKILRYTNKNYHELGSDLWQLKYPVA